MLPFENLSIQGLKSFIQTQIMLLLVELLPELLLQQQQLQQQLQQQDLWLSKTFWTLNGKILKR